MASVFPNGRYESTFTAVTTTSETVILTVPAGYHWAEITQIWANGATGAASTITLKVTRAGTSYVFASGEAMASNAHYDVEFKPMVLQPNDTIKATVSTATVNFMVSYLNGAADKPDNRSR